MQPHKKIKVIFISHDAMLHGATRSMIDIADNLRCFVDSHVVLPYGGLAELLLKERRIMYSILNYPLLISYIKKVEFRKQVKQLLKSFKNLKALIKNINNISPDVIYVNTLANYWILILRIFVKKPFIFHIREFGDLDHGMKLFFNGILFRIFKSLPDLIIVNSKSVGEYFLKKYNIDSKVIYNGVVSKAAFNKNLSEKVNYIKHDDIINIGIIGNVGFGKGQFDVLKAFHQVQTQLLGVKLFIIGGGRDAERLQQYINSNNLQKRVEITGFVTNVDDYYKMLDIVIVNSLMEAFGRVVIEAASYSIPVIGRETGATKELIRNKITGLYTDGSEKDLVEKMLLLINDSDLRKKLGTMAWIVAKDNYNLDDHIQQIKEVVFDTYYA